jgi:uncharacterized phage infection (PIP) family protein YhgE
MKTFYVGLIMLFFFDQLNAQIVVKPSFNNPGNYILKKLHKNDTLLILCDTVYLVNRPLFLVYSGLYSKQKNIQQVISESSEIFQGHINDQGIQFEKLNSEFQRTLDQFKKYKECTKQNLDSLQTGISGAEESLARAKKENEKLKEQIGKALQKNNSQKFYFGLAGISIGLVIALLLIK